MHCDGWLIWFCNLFLTHFWCHLFLIPDIKFSTVSDLVACCSLNKSFATLPSGMRFTSLVFSFPFLSQFSLGHILLSTSLILLVHRALSFELFHGTHCLCCPFLILPCIYSSFPPFIDKYTIFLYKVERTLKLGTISYTHLNFPLSLM